MKLPKAIGSACATLIFVFLLLAPEGLALVPGEYTDYVYETDYNYPQEPAHIELNCSFFYTDDNACDLLEKVPNSSKKSIVLGMIRKQYPDENQDWVRYWNKLLPVGRYYENATIEELNMSDGMRGENGSLKNTWFRLIHIYPSVFDEKDGYYYVPKQALLLTKSEIDFVVPNPQEGEWCKQKYDISGYDYELKTKIKDFETTSHIIPISGILWPSEKANLTLELNAIGKYSHNLSAWANETECVGANCTITTVCKINQSSDVEDMLNLSADFPIKRYPDAFYYDNKLAVPARGFAKGIVDLQLPEDFLYYQISVKGQSFVLRKNEIKIVSRGEVYPVLQVNLISAPSKSGTLHITSLNESVQGGVYNAQIKYKVFVESPDVKESDCYFYVFTPFGIREIEDACRTMRSNAKLELRILNISNGEAIVVAKVRDQLENPVEGIQVEFSGGQSPQRKTTDAEGNTEVIILQRESTQTIVAEIIESENVAGAKDTIFIPGKGAGPEGKIQVLDLLWQASPILLIMLIVSTMLMWVMKKRSNTAWALAPLLIIAILSSNIFAQETDGIDEIDVQATLDACKNYDFDNAVRHFGECAEAYRISTEFSAMRRTATVLVANIAPLIVANPDIKPYKSAYINMVLIALALFRVAWAFNSLYLILNIFNPTKRSQALNQYMWLIVFVIFVYASFSIVQDTISAVNSVSTWIVGTDAASTLSQATLSAEFIVENYEMLKLMLPFLNLSYLILLARYITVIGMILFFPFSLLLFFTSATRGFGKAALTVTFAALGLGVLNAILLLIYNILLKTSDPALSGSFATTFFSASFIVFFGFVNLVVLLIAFFSGIVFIGRGNS
ncbi:MAG: Ig-like domain-containing protein [Candidatus Micrarchaeota archaeon]